MPHPSDLSGDADGDPLAEFQLLGPLGLLDSARRPLTGFLSGSKRVAVLAYLATAPNGSLRRRDALMGLFWPESDDARARSALRSALHTIRREVGDVVETRGGDEVGVRPGALRCDVCAFRDLLAAGRRAEAMALYRGDLLAGFHLSGAPDFERWLDRERTALRAQAHRAAAALSQEARDAADCDTAVHWARQAVRLEPYDERSIRRLLECLDAAGDRAAALQVYETFAAELARELAMEPSTETRTLIAAMRGPIVKAPARAPSRRSRVDAADTGAAPAPARGRRAWIMAAATAAVLAAIGLTIHLDSHAGSASTAETVAILPFNVDAAAVPLRYLREGMVDLLASELSGNRGLRAVEPRVSIAAARSLDGSGDTAGAAQRVAQRLGAAEDLTGQIVGRAQRMVVQVTLTDVRTGKVRAQARAAGPEDSLSVMVDRIVAELLLRDAGEDEATVASLVHHPLDALRVFLKARHDYRSGAYVAAANGYAEALRQDSTFLQAALGLLTAARFTPNAQRVGDARRLLWAHRRELPLPDRRFLDGLLGGTAPGVPPRYADVLAAWSRAVQAAPERADAWYELGDVTYHWGAVLGIGDADNRARVDFQRALALDSAFVMPADHLLLLAERRHDRAAVERLRAQILALHPSADETQFVQWVSAAALGDSAAIAAAHAALPTAGMETLWRIAGVAQLEGIDMRAADLAIRQALRRNGGTAEAVTTLELAHDLALNEGHPGRAAAYTARLAELPRLSLDRLIIPITDALFDGGDSVYAERFARRAQRALGTAHVDSLPTNYYLAVPWLALHDHEVLRRPPKLDHLIGIQMLDALAALSHHDPDARTRVNHFVRTVEGGVGYFRRPTLPLIAARMELALGDTADALAVVRRRPNEWDETALLAASYRMEARLAAALGDTTEAEAAHAHYLVLRQARGGTTG